ncbi:MAG: acetolactate synthase large subunit, partial [Deltaproteobacteria bacterium]|nr:acetolactate synthase large subunit [Deltaproteobacteria bacterium]
MVERSGAESLLQTAASAGVEICFANPGTSEMPVVAALDRVAGIRAVLATFEGVCTGAADGYGRMADRPALTLLHHGPGFANGIANLHNAWRARSPLVNLVGDHPDHHLPFDAPLTSDIESLARPCSDWVRRASSAKDLASDAAEALAVAGARPGHVATLVVPSDLAAGASPGPVAPRRPAPTPAPPSDRVESIAAALRGGEPGAILLGALGMREPGLRAAARVAAATGARLIAETFPSRLERGAGLPSLERLPYFPEHVLQTLAEVRWLVLAGA